MYILVDNDAIVVTFAHVIGTIAECKAYQIANELQTTTYIKSY